MALVHEFLVVDQGHLIEQYSRVRAGMQAGVSALSTFGAVYSARLAGAARIHGEGMIRRIKPSNSGTVKAVSPWAGL